MFMAPLCCSYVHVKFSWGSFIYFWFCVMRRNGKRSDSSKERKHNWAFWSVFLVGWGTRNKQKLKIFVAGRGECPLSLGGWEAVKCLLVEGQESWESWGSRSPWDRGFASSHLPVGCMCHIHPSRITASHHQQHPTPLPCPFVPLRWKVAGQLGSPPPRESSHHKAGRASWKTKGGRGAHQANVSLQSLLWPVQQKLILPGVLGCVLWTSRGWVMLWKPQAQTLAQTSPCREEAEKKSSDYYKMCCAQCSAVPSPVHAPGFLPSIHPPKYWSPINGDCRQHMK